MQSIDTYLIEAIEIVCGWDLDDDSTFTNAVNSQAKLLAGVPSDQLWHVDPETPMH